MQLGAVTRHALDPSWAQKKVRGLRGTTRPSLPMPAGDVTAQIARVQLRGGLGARAALAQRRRLEGEEVGRGAAAHTQRGDLPIPAPADDFFFRAEQRTRADHERPGMFKIRDGIPWKPLQTRPRWWQAAALQATTTRGGATDAAAAASHTPPRLSRTYGTLPRAAEPSACLPTDAPARDSAAARSRRRDLDARSTAGAAAQFGSANPEEEAARARNAAETRRLPRTPRGRRRAHVAKRLRRQRERRPGGCPEVLPQCYRCFRFAWPRKPTREDRPLPG
ncbi:hypothetical protein MTO96_025709 [Rhipicephalus appendiculatus]